LHALIRVVGPSLKQKKMNMRKNKSIKTIVGMFIARLGSGNSLQMCGEVYGIVKSIISIILKKLCNN
jgi:ascorbate-specific PTS system EIIC-type component UlaA